MAGTHQGVQRSVAPYPSPGRNFVSTDPERQREAGAESLRSSLARESSHHAQSKHARSASAFSRTSVNPARVWWGIGDDEGGSGRGSR